MIKKKKRTGRNIEYLLFRKRQNDKKYGDILSIISKEVCGKKLTEQEKKLLSKVVI